VDIVYTRMAAGPMDYTPGAMRNSVEGDFYTSFENPMSYGTRCHQLGMFVVYFAPLQMLCDAPTEYEKYPDILNFISRIPVSWDETHVIDGKMGEYVVIARRKGDDWYIGGLTNWEERQLEIALSDFTEGDYMAEIFTDGVNANRKASDYVHEKVSVTSGQSLSVVMKKGGGFVIHLQKTKG
ncbi:MAG: glycoside hydrolase family 97 C-terminal domain-containing protein, partial [Bacteroidales bacterium]|nr:glycoside hydrolase family 97 C-terminal domain-containing protein [Bacteroidales bacterium]